MLSQVRQKLPCHWCMGSIVSLNPAVPTTWVQFSGCCFQVSIVPSNLPPFFFGYGFKSEGPPGTSSRPKVYSELSWFLPNEHQPIHPYGKRTQPFRYTHRHILWTLTSCMSVFRRPCIYWVRIWLMYQRRSASNLLLQCRGVFKSFEWQSPIFYSSLADRFIFML